MTADRPPWPPFTPAAAVAKMRLAGDAWSGREPGRVALAGAAATSFTEAGNAEASVVESTFGRRAPRPQSWVDAGPHPAIGYICQRHAGKAWL